jgi:hypothetical protein
MFPDEGEKGEKMTIQIAQEIVAFCANCNRDLAHTITAMEEGRITGVICGSCKEEHPFKSPTPKAAAPKKRSTKKAQIKRSVTEDWIMEMERVQDVSATSYTMAGHYSERQKLSHHAFGLGLVQKLVPPDKMEVLFEGGIKMLIRGA